MWSDDPDARFSGFAHILTALASTRTVRSLGASLDRVWDQLRSPTEQALVMRWVNELDGALEDKKLFVRAHLLREHTFEEFARMMEEHEIVLREKLRVMARTEALRVVADTEAHDFPASWTLLPDLPALASAARVNTTAKAAKWYRGVASRAREHVRRKLYKRWYLVPVCEHSHPHVPRAALPPDGHGYLVKEPTKTAKRLSKVLEHTAKALDVASIVATMLGVPVPKFGTALRTMCADETAEVVEAVAEQLAAISDKAQRSLDALGGVDAADLDAVREVVGADEARRLQCMLRKCMVLDVGDVDAERSSARWLCDECRAQHYERVDASRDNLWRLKLKFVAQ